MRSELAVFMLKSMGAATAACLTLVLGLIGSAAAVSIPVANYSFEDPTIPAPPADQYIVGLPTSWSDLGSDGPFVETNAALGFSGGDAAQYAGMNGGTIYQDLGVAFAPNTIYSVEVATAHRSSFTNGTLEFGLFSSSSLGTDLGTPGFADIQGVWPGSGNPDGDEMYNQFRDSAVLATIGSGALGQPYSFTTGAVAPSGNAVVFLRQAGGSRVNFDNVRVTAVPVPEPGCIAFVAIAFGSLWAVGGRRK